MFTSARYSNAFNILENVSIMSEAAFLYIMFNDILVFFNEQNELQCRISDLKMCILLGKAGFVHSKGLSRGNFCVLECGCLKSFVRKKQGRFSQKRVVVWRGAAEISNVGLCSRHGTGGKQRRKKGLFDRGSCESQF